MNLSNEVRSSKFVTRKWNIVNDQSNGKYDVGNKIIYKAVLRYNLCDYNDVYILVTGDIAISRDNWAERAFKNYETLIKCITKFAETTIDYAGDLDLVMPLYNLLEYSSKYPDATGSLWFYLKDEVTNFNADTAYNNDNNNFKSFDCKAK